MSRLAPGVGFARWAAPPDPTSADWAYWQRCAADCEDRADELSTKELEFVHSIARRRGEPSSKQLAWLIAILDRLFGRAPA